jgi:hypothetical protein
MENLDNNIQPDEPRADASDPHWGAVDRVFELYHEEPEYGEHLAQVFRLFGLGPTNSFNTKDNPMGMTKNYFLNLLQQCSEEQFGQEAIEWAIVSGFVNLSCHMDRDVRNIMSKYDDIIDGYRKAKASKAEDGSHPVKPGLPARLGPRHARVAGDRPEATVKRKEKAA